MRFFKLFAVLFISLLFSVSTISAPLLLTPQQTVKKFIIDYEKWNDAATQALSEDNGFSAKKEYDKLLNKYCTQGPDRVGYDVYGQYSLHLSDSEKILNTKKNNHEIVIKTSIPSRFGKTEDEMDYFEYHLVFQNGKYLISEIYQLTESGKKNKTL